MRDIAAGQQYRDHDDRPSQNAEVSLRRQKIEPARAQTQAGRTAYQISAGSWLLKIIVPDAANIPPTPWQTEIFAPSICAGDVPRI